MECETKLLRNLDIVEVIDGVDKYKRTTTWLVLPLQLLKGSAILKDLVITLTNSITTPLHSAV